MSEDFHVADSTSLFYTKSDDLTVVTRTQLTTLLHGKQFYILGNKISKHNPVGIP